MAMSEEKLVLVNFLDKAIGEETKMETHRKGLLHRAFSVFLYNANPAISPISSHPVVSQSIFIIKRFILLFIHLPPSM